MRVPLTLSRAIALTFLSGPALVQASVSLAIPPGHPRLWYGDAARLQQARTYYATHAIDIPSYPPSAQARNRALRYLMTGNTADCAQAIDWLMRFNYENADEDGDGQADPGSCNLSSEGRYCDRARWSGEDAILVYDWCHAELTSAQKNTLIARWNRYTTALNVGPYGWQDRPVNNYYWGYLRNSLLWGIAAFGESPLAQQYIDHALETRFAQYFVPWSQGYGRGGVPGEGTQYGPYPLGYSVIALRTAADFGYDGRAQTAFFDAATYYLAYATSPAPTLSPNPANPRYEMFPFGDDEDFRNGGSAQQRDYANLLGATVLQAPASARAKHARAWLARTGEQPDWWIRAALAAAPGASDASDLPLDYYAAGYAFVYGRSDRSATASSLLLELGALGADERGGLEHDGLEAGTFQFWHKGLWASRATAGYRGSDFVAGLAGSGRADVHDAIAHNAVLFEGKGQVSSFAGQPVVKRLQSADDYLYAAVDLRPGYRSAPVSPSQCWLAEDDWPYSDAVVREFVYLRSWNALVVLDRLRASSDSLLPVYSDPCGGSGFSGPHKAAAAVRKTAVVHFSKSPAINGNRVGAVNGTQAFDAHLLLPASSSPRIVDERNCSGCGLGQFRLEVDDSGSADTYFLQVLHARDASAAPLTATLSSSGGDWIVQLVRADGARATLTLHQGIAALGGSVRFGTEPVQPLYTNVQGMQILPSGPVWQSLSDPIFEDDFEVP
ncbi:MAG: hypothetical protein JNN30_08860 [Rhodanobacteraceae bacterium]|nr:hypothetical protein [Rhodanobacteraceae bacterium]